MLILKTLTKLLVSLLLLEQGSLSLLEKILLVLYHELLFR